MKSYLGNLRVKHKLWLIVGVALVGMGFLQVSSLNSLRSNLLHDRQVKTQHVVETAHSVLAHFQAQASKGLIGDTDARLMAQKVIQDLRYEGNQYFWINDMQRVMIMHPVKPELNGRDLTNLEDAKGRKVFSEFVRKVNKSGDGFVEYLWPKPGADEPVDKISYVKGFKPWGWVIGSGIYIDDVNAIYWDNVKQSGFIFTAILLLIGVVSWGVTRLIANPVSNLHEIMRHVAGHNDLTRRVEVTSKDELGQMAESFNEMLGAFQRSVGNVSQSVDQLASSAEELATVTNQTNEGITQQHLEIDQVAAAMNEMSCTVFEVAKNTENTARATEEATIEVKKGYKLVSNATVVIERLSSEIDRAAVVIHGLEEQSESIGSILDVIRGIADQTNLLALNAAIEAARAGEQGRGFAVVADEVRTLASRTQESTTEIQVMIERLQAGAQEAVSVMEDSRRQAGEGVIQISSAGESLGLINKAVDTISDMSVQIASAAEEQTAVAEEMNRNVTNISAVAEQTAQGSQQTYVASEELATLAEGLQLVTSQFRV